MQPDESPMNNPPPPGGSPDPRVTPLAPAPPSTARPRPDTPRISDFWALMGCNAIVFGASVCIMVLELTASRLIAVHQGSSLYTWTSVIGVVLAGISFGNYLGGWLADRYAPQKVLGWLFLVSGLFTFSVLWLNQWAANSHRPQSMGWQAWVIFVVAWIFLLPALALGTISPVTASIALTRSRKTGMTVGNVYAWGALGSIVGTFLTGFYLVDVLGTRMIIVCTALTLLTMSLLVAGGQWAFRALVLFGAVQFVTVIGCCAAADEDRLASLGGKFGSASAWFSSSSEREKSAEAWTEWGRQLGRSLHELGRVLALRDDRRGEYNDESNYFAINISGDNQDGDSVKELKLDHLLHSYYNADNPTKLYYDYERVYAAITERAANEWERTTEVNLRVPPVADFKVALPPEMSYDSDRKRLTIRGAMSFEQFKQLAALGPDGDYWQAILQTWQQSNEDKITFFATPLAKLPDGVVFPKDLAGQIYWDGSLQAIICNQRLAFDDALKLMYLAPRGAYITALQELFQRSRKVSTMFIGGGGFVFPRWIESKFPWQPVIDVAEIDPAVKLAVQQELGLPPDDQTSVRTHIGDARTFVDERRNMNADLLSRNQPPVLYDFIYGDAFNDFSVPWHLTTREFSEKVKDLLTPGAGVYLVNVIDIYPRAEYPPADRKVNFGQTTYSGILPSGLLLHELQPDKWIAARPPFQQLEIQELLEGEKYLLRYNGLMSQEMRDRFRDLSLQDQRERANRGELKVNPALDSNFREAIRDLQALTKARLVVPTLPAALVPPDLEGVAWTEVPGFENLEIRKKDHGYLLGFRGVMTDELRERLLKVAPQDKELEGAVQALYRASHDEPAGQFLGRYVNTVRQVFPFVYLFAGNEDAPGDDRDTFVVACSLKKLDLDNLERSGGYWKGKPFAWVQNTGATEELHGQMRAVLESARGLTLTDDFAPVDNLLAPVFVRQ